MDFILSAAFFITSFLLGVVAVRFVAAKNKKRGIIGLDINKRKETRIPESVGIALLIPIWLCSIAFSLYYGNPAGVYWAALVTLFAIVGFFDDTKPKFLSQTRRWRYRALLIAAISLGFSALFFSAPVELLLAALFIAGIASFENTFAGLNGWEVGSGFILSVFFGLVLLGFAYFPLAAVLAGSVLALLAFNAFPARVFPGDSGTMLIGSGLAGLMVLTRDIRLMSVAFLFFLPHIVDFFSKILSNPRDPSQRKSKPYEILKDSRIAMPRGKTRKYDFAKILIRILGPMSEKRIVLIIWAIVVLNCSVIYLVFA